MQKYMRKSEIPTILEASGLWVNSGQCCVTFLSGSLVSSPHQIFKLPEVPQCFHQCLNKGHCPAHSHQIGNKHCWQKINSCQGKFIGHKERCSFLVCLFFWTTHWFSWQYLLFFVYCWSCNLKDFEF